MRRHGYTEVLSLTPLEVEHSLLELNYSVAQANGKKGTSPFPKIYPPGFNQAKHKIAPNEEELEQSLNTLKEFTKSK